MAKISNIPLAKMRKWLKSIGCEYRNTNGGHENWTKEGVRRLITLQTHKDPVPEFIVLQCIKQLGVSKEDFLKQIDAL